MNAPLDRQDAERALWLAAYDRPVPDAPRRADPAHRLPPVVPEYAHATPLELDLDELHAAYADLVWEWAGLALENMRDDEVRAYLARTLPWTVPPAVRVDLRLALNHLRRRYREVGIERTAGRAGGSE